MVYTHSEEKWAIKVCEAMERMAGWPFIKRVFSRMDCKVGCVCICACVHAQFVCACLYVKTCVCVYVYIYTHQHRNTHSHNVHQDGHPNFPARKSLEFVVESLKAQDGLAWADVDNTIMFDDDGNALGKAEQDRLVKVASYDHWEPCQWDEVLVTDTCHAHHDMCMLYVCMYVCLLV